MCGMCFTTQCGKLSVKNARGWVGGVGGGGGGYGVAGSRYGSTEDKRTNQPIDQPMGPMGECRGDCSVTQNPQLSINGGGKGGGGGLNGEGGVHAWEGGVCRNGGAGGGGLL